MKRVILAVAILLTSYVTATPAQAVKAGSGCRELGAISSDLVCFKKGKKLTWQILDSTEKVQSVINLSLKRNKLPKNLAPALNKARTDKSIWLDQECAVDFPDVKVPDCLAGDLKGKKTMVVYGDSHASMWMTALDPIAKSNGYKIHLFAKLACPLVEATIWSYQLNKPFNECSEWQQLVLPKIQALNPDLLVVTDQWKPAVVDGKKSDIDTVNLWETEFPKALSKLKSMSKRLVLISNNPSMQQDSVACASKPNANLGLCASGRNQAGNVQINRIEEEAAKSIGAIFIDAVDLACTDYLCPVVVGNKFVYFDQWHFTATYVKWLTPVVRKAMNL